MKIVEKDGRSLIQIDAYELLHEIFTPEQREQFIESVSCAEEVIEHVAEQIIEGFTNNGYSGSWSTGLDTALQRARRKLAENYDEAAKRTITDLEQKISILNNTVEHYQEMLSKPERY